MAHGDRGPARAGNRTRARRFADASRTSGDAFPREGEGYGAYGPRSARSSFLPGPAESGRRPAAVVESALIDLPLQKLDQLRGESFAVADDFALP